MDVASSDHHAGGAQPTPPQGRARELVEEVMTAMAERLDEATTAVAEAIHATLPLPEELRAATWRSTRANLDLTGALMLHGPADTSPAPPPEALAYARTLARDGLALDTLVATYRLGQRVYLRLCLDETSRHTADAADMATALRWMEDVAYRYVDDVVAALAVAYARELERLDASTLAARTGAVRDVLAGGRVDLDQVSSRLRYRLDALHVAFLVWDGAEDGEPEGSWGDDPPADVAALAERLGDALGALGLLVVPLGRTLAGWAAVPSSDEAAPLPVGERGLRVAVGSAQRGLEGFRRSHEEARITRRVASLGGRRGAATATFAASALDALLAADLDEARRFVRRELGDLEDGADVARRVRATLEVYLEEGHSPVRAARRLGVHENTVTYRVRRAEELLGRSVRERQLELRCALRLARRLSSPG